MDLSDRPDEYLSDLSGNFPLRNIQKPVVFIFFARLLPSGAELQPSRLFGDGRGGGCPARDCLRSCVLYIESDGSSVIPGKLAGPGCSVRSGVQLRPPHCGDGAGPATAASDRRLGWAPGSVGGGAVGRGGFYS